MKTIESHLRICRWASGRHGKHQRFFRNHDPRDGICQQSYASHNRRNQPYQPYKIHVEIKILGDPEANTGNRASGSRAHQTFAGDYPTHASSTISANIGVILNHFSAIVTVHGFSSLSLLSQEYAAAIPKVPYSPLYGSFRYSVAVSANFDLLSAAITA